MHHHPDPNNRHRHVHLANSASRHHRLAHHKQNMSSPQDWQREAMRRFRQMQQSGGGRGGPGGRMPSAGLFAGGLLLTAGFYVVSNSLFNVDGGHRAIKYKRVSGVSNEIYNEGMSGSESTGCYPEGDGR